MHVFHDLRRRAEVESVFLDQRRQVAIEAVDIRQSAAQYDHVGIQNIDHGRQCPCETIKPAVHCGAFFCAPRGGNFLRCGISPHPPPRPGAPPSTLPSTPTPPPTPVPAITPNTVAAPAAAPSLASDSAKQLASLASRTARPSTCSRSCRSGFPIR